MKQFFWDFFGKNYKNKLEQVEDSTDEGETENKGKKILPGIVGFEMSCFLLFIVKLFSAVGLSIYFNYMLQKSLFVNYKVDVAASEFEASYALGFLILLVLFLFFWSVTGKYLLTMVYYSLGMALLIFANNQKVELRSEPIFPEELEMLGQSKELLTMIDAKYIKVGIMALVLSVLFITIYYFVFKRRYMGKFKALLGLNDAEVKQSAGRRFYFIGRIVTILVTSCLLYLSYNYNESPKIEKLLQVD